MARLFFTGFETGDSAELQSLSSGCSISNASKRTGGYAMKVAGVASSSALGVASTTFNNSRLYFRTYFMIGNGNAPANANSIFIAQFYDSAYANHLGSVVAGHNTDDSKNLQILNAAFATVGTYTIT